MVMETPERILWTAQRHGQDWDDPELLSALEWFGSSVSRHDLDRRLEAVEARFQTAKSAWASGNRTPLYDPSDLIAWYLHQARAYGDHALRQDFYEPEGYRIVPLFRRLGQLLPDLKKVVGVGERVERVMTEGRSQPDDGIFELLVAGAYAIRGWERVEFVPEMRGIAKRPDLFVGRRHESWAIECKRAGRSGYAREERLAGEAMVDLIHRTSLREKRPVVVAVTFRAELAELPRSYLAGKLATFLDGTAPHKWDDGESEGGIWDIEWAPLRTVLRTDDIYFGSSRMAELLLGEYDPTLDFSVGGEWSPAAGRPFHATSVEHSSIVVWRSASETADRRKSQHFKSIIARASEQLPGDRPGAIHVGYEAVGGNSVDGRRHRLNLRETFAFEARGSRLRWVYGNYFMPERTTARNESSAVTETMAWYPIRGSREKQPLPGHMLFLDGDGAAGTHFKR